MDNIKRDESLNVGELFIKAEATSNEFTEDGGIIINQKEKGPSEVEEKIANKFKELNVAIKSHEDETIANSVREIADSQKVRNEIPSNDAMELVKKAFAGKDVTIDGKAVNREAVMEANPVPEQEVQQPRQDQMQKVEEVEKEPVVNSQPNSDIVRIDLKEGQSQDFISQLSKEERKKVQTAKSIVVTEVKEVKIPTAKRKITSLTQFKELATSGLTSETVMVPLPNSKFLVYVKGCGSLAMATLMGDTSNHLDYIKRVEFCFKQITHTSIGQLSFDEFTKRVSPDDIDLIIHGILKASNPDQDEVQLTCGNPKCAKTFNFKYTISTLIDVEDSHKDLLDTVGKITTAARTITDAKEYHESAAIRNTKVVELPSGHIIELVTPTVYTLIEKLPLRKQIEQDYNMFTAMVSIMIGKLFIKGTNDEGEVEYYEVDDIDVLASIIYGFSDKDLAVIKEITTKMEDLGQTAFSIREVDCPHCGYHQDKVPLDMDSMVFMKLRMSQII